MPRHTRRPRILFAFAALLLFNFDADAQRRAPQRRPDEGARAAGAPRLVPNRVSLSGGRSFVLNLPEGFGLSVAADGLKRVRFMAESPEGRLFVTDMYNLTDNKRGAVYILDGFDPAAKKFAKVTPYLNGLRNPNSVAFHTDERGVEWLYLALTHSLVRFRYTRGEDAPSAQPQTLTAFPDYGLNYKYGGWHLTRTVAFGPTGKLYVSVGSSCNACIEKEEIRASIVEMDADGKNQRLYARGLRNAVGLRFVGGRLYATDMGADHLGRDRPADTMYVVRDGRNYGWPYCYQSGAKVLPDPKFNPRGRKFPCRDVPAPYAAFDAHSAPLGLEHFGAGDAAGLGDSFLVALHGSTNKRLGRGYKVVRVPAGGGRPEDFITGFLSGGKVNGRPADIYSYGDGFLLTDDHAGAIYYVYKK